MSKLPYVLIVCALVLLSYGLGYSSYPLLHPSLDVARGMGRSGVEIAAASAREGDTRFAPGASNPAHPPHESATLELSNIDPATLNLYKEAWEALDQNFYGGAPDTTERIYGAIRGLVESYADPYTFFLEPEPHEIEHNSLQGRFGGVGAEIEATEAGYVLNPLRDQPAAQAGIHAGDLLIRVDETSVTRDMTVDEVVALIRGPIDTEVTLVVRHTITPAESQGDPVFRAGAREERTFTLTRAEIQTPSMDWRLLNRAELPADQPAARIGYIEHRLFSDRSPDEMRTALDELQAAGADRFILDLRGNPGGYVNAVVAIADMWLDGGVVMVEERVNGEEQVFETSSETVVDNAPLVVVVDGASASASEILAGALRDHGRGLLLGEKTFGKGSVQIIHELSDQSSIHITNAVWFTPNGHRIDGAGLVPDVVIEPGSDPLPQAIDAVLGLEPGVRVDARTVSFR